MKINNNSSKVCNLTIVEPKSNNGNNLLRVKSRNIPIKGKTSCPDQKHYIVVEPSRTSVPIVEKELTVQATNKTWSGKVTLGNEGTSSDEIFIVNVISTQRCNLSQGVPLRDCKKFSSSDLIEIKVE